MVIDLRVQRFLGRAKVWCAGLCIGLFAAMTVVLAQDVNPSTPDTSPSAAKTAGTSPAPAPGVAAGDYTISAEDLLDIDVLDVPELSRTYRVSSNGFLTLPLLTQPIAVEGLTLDQLSQLIAKRFKEAGMLNDAQVSVSLKETRLHTVLISGEIKTGQALPLYGPTRLIDVLVKAGGLSPAAGDTAIITRGDIGAHADAAESAKTGEPNLSADSRSFSLNIRKLVDTGDDPSNNIMMYPGDRVMVQRAEMIYVLGAVARPGGYVLNDSRQHITVLKALAMAGDVNNIAKRSSIMILRKDSTVEAEKRKEIPVDYRAMSRGKTDDIRLVPDDIVFVPESSALKAIHATTQAAVAVASTGGSALVIYR